MRRFILRRATVADAPARPRARTRWLALAALLAIAVLVRVSSMFYGFLSGDDGTVALVAKHFLRGEDFPVYFYRQTYMGSLNGIHLVPALFLFGPSVLVVRLNAIAWSLLFPLGVYLLGRRVFDETAGRAALALAAVPPFLVTYWSTVAEPHFETNVFGVWLLLLALAALAAPSEPARIRALAAFGLLAGLAWWSSFKVIEILAPASCCWSSGAPDEPSAATEPWWRRVDSCVGSLPVWLFYALHGDSARGTPGSAVPFFSVGIDFSWERLSEFWRHAVLQLLGTYYWDPTTPMRRVGLTLNVALYAAAVGLALLEALRRRRRGDAPDGAGLGPLAGPARPPGIDRRPLLLALREIARARQLALHPAGVHPALRVRRRPRRAGRTPVAGARRRPARLSPRVRPVDPRRVPVAAPAGAPRPAGQPPRGPRGRPAASRHAAGRRAVHRRQPAGARLGLSPGPPTRVGCRQRDLRPERGGGRCSRTDCDPGLATGTGRQPRHPRRNLARDADRRLATLRGHPGLSAELPDGAPPRMAGPGRSDRSRPRSRTGTSPRPGPRSSMRVARPTRSWWTSAAATTWRGSSSGRRCRPPTCSGSGSRAGRMGAPGSRSA